MSSPVILILGAGANIGKSVAHTFAKNGYKVALVGRKLAAHAGSTKELQIKADFTNPASIKTVFDEVTSKLGVPNVIVYNAAAGTYSPADPFAASTEGFAKNLAVNVTSVYEAVKYAVAGFETLPAGVTKTFIFTGNNLIKQPSVALFDLGVGKAAAAQMILTLSLNYADKGFQFYYGDERKADGSAAFREISGDNHAAFYAQLTERETQGPWLATFVGGKGYVDFEN